MKKIKSNNIIRYFLLSISVILVLGAIAGAVGFIGDPSGNSMGMAESLPYFQVLPFAEFFFQNFLWCGIALLIVIGLPNLVQCVLLAKSWCYAPYCGIALGVVLILWICVQLYIFPEVYAIDAIFLGVGIVQTILSILLAARQRIRTVR